MESSEDLSHLGVRPNLKKYDEFSMSSRFLASNEQYVSTELLRGVSTHSFLGSKNDSSGYCPIDEYANQNSDTRASSISETTPEHVPGQRRAATYLANSFELDLCPSVHDTETEHSTMLDFCSRVLKTEKSLDSPSKVTVNLIKKRVINKSNPVMPISPMVLSNECLVYIGCDVSRTYLVHDSLYKELKSIHEINTLPPIFGIQVDVFEQTLCLCGTEEELSIHRVPKDTSMGISELSKFEISDSITAVVPCKDSFLVFGTYGKIHLLGIYGTNKSLYNDSTIVFDTVTYSKGSDGGHTFCCMTSDNSIMLGSFDDNKESFTYNWITKPNIIKARLLLFGDQLLAIDNRDGTSYLFKDDNWVPVMVKADRRFHETFVKDVIPKDLNTNIYAYMDGSSAMIYELMISNISVREIMAAYVGLATELRDQLNKR